MGTNRLWRWLWPLALCSWLLVLGFLLPSCRSENPVEGVTTTYKVALIMPQPLWESERSIVAGALANIDRAQRGLTRRVGIEVEWIDEDAPNLSNGVKCTFIPESAWPENAGAAEEILNEQYYLGAIVEKTKDEGFGSGTFVVIAPWTPQECGLMIKLAPNASYFDDMPKKKCSSANTLHRVYRELHKDNNYQEIFVTKGQEVGWPETLGGWYLTKTKKGAAYYCVNLETNGEKFYNPDSGRKIESAPAHRAPAADAQKLRMAYCYCFKPKGDKIKFW